MPDALPIGITHAEQSHSGMFATKHGVQSASGIMAQAQQTTSAVTGAYDGATALVAVADR